LPFDAPPGGNQGSDALGAPHREVSAAQAEIEFEVRGRPDELPAKNRDPLPTMGFQEGEIDAARFESRAQADPIVAEPSHRLDCALLDLELAGGKDLIHSAA